MIYVQYIEKNITELFTLKEIKDIHRYYNDFKKLTSLDVFKRLQKNKPEIKLYKKDMDEFIKWNIDNHNKHHIESLNGVKIWSFIPSSKDCKFVVVKT